MIARVLAMTAAMSLAVAPVAAEAGTRAMDSAVSLQPLTELHHGLNEDDIEGAGIFADLPVGLLLGLLAGLAGIGLVIASDASENDASPGTGG